MNSDTNSNCQGYKPVPVGIFLFILMINVGNWVASVTELWLPISTIPIDFQLFQKLFGGGLSSTVQVAILPYTVIFILVFCLLYSVSKMGSI